jgi:hypothetical protein
MHLNGFLHFLTGLILFLEKDQRNSGLCHTEYLPDIKKERMHLKAGCDDRVICAYAFCETQRGL